MILRLYFIFLISSISDINSSILILTLNTSITELIWLINKQSILCTIYFALSNKWWSTKMVFETNHIFKIATYLWGG